MALYGAAYEIFSQADRPHPCTETAAQALAAGPLDAVGESPKAKTAFLVAQGAMSFEDSERTATQDLAEQMQDFMAGSGLDPGAYDLQPFTEERHSDLKVLCMAVVRKEAPRTAAAVLAEGRAEATPAGKPPDEKIEAWAAEIRAAQGQENRWQGIGCAILVVAIVAAALIIWLSGLSYT